MTPDDILQFWFADGPDAFRQAWFQKNDDFDNDIRTRFGTLIAPARGGALDAWATTAGGALALLIVLDQFPRNLLRGSADAFASDPHARHIARGALAQRLDMAVTPIQRPFIYLPFEHSEDAADQDLSCALFEGLRDTPKHAAQNGAIEYAWRHRVVIRRFGRFPHRNAALGRVNTAAEVAYLAQPGAGF